MTLRRIITLAVVAVAVAPTAALAATLVATPTATPVAVGHGVDLTNPCTAAGLTDFLLHDRLPASDAACGAGS
ncbi:hypothetical protein [Amycolatopsis sp. NBC_01480]|uniref:hypothetical protein n=1 Tax=Amycolatopsis sp. NBC_01480 TaxID=2903562 RepID=UPI002E28D3D0|nr:hypothetical protein [Amycolatopsis sp. NBC_01480]